MFTWTEEMTVELTDLTEGLLVKCLGFEATMSLVTNLKSWFEGKVSSPWQSPARWLSGSRILNRKLKVPKENQLSAGITLAAHVKIRKFFSEQQTSKKIIIFGTEFHSRRYIFFKYSQNPTLTRFKVVLHIGNYLAVWNSTIEILEKGAKSIKS